MSKGNNGWIKSDKYAPVDDGYFIVHCPEYEQSIAITRYDADLGGWVIMRMMKYLTGNHYHNHQKMNNKPPLLWAVFYFKRK
nr:MAG TPA: hypothetical protein [Bacteriophage sp.]